MTPKIAWRPLGVVTGIVAAVLFGLSGRYGYHRDELYYLAAGRHPAWGYDDQPPVVVVLARLADELAGGSLMALRFPAALAAAATVLLTGLIARELGGQARAQVLAAAAMAVAPITIIAGHLLSTTILDIFWWTLIVFLFARYLRVPTKWLLIIAGPVIGLALLTKSLVVLFLIGLAAGLLIAGPREIFRRPQLWLAAAIALAMWAPNLRWQATHGWPQLRMTALIRDDADWGGQLFVVPMQFLITGLFVAAIWVAGLWRLRRHPFGIAYLVVLALVLVTGGRMYYVAGAYPALIAAGAIVTVAWLKTWVLHTAIALTAMWTVMQALPVFPIDRLADTHQPAVNYDSGETVGWPELAATVERVHATVPDAVVVANNYGQAGAIARYTELEVYSGHLAFWRWGPPPDSKRTVVVIGNVRLDCESLEIAARHDNGHRIDNDEQGVPIRICRGLRQPWAQIWPGLRHL